MSEQNQATTMTGTNQFVFELHMKTRRGVSLPVGLFKDDAGNKHGGGACKECAVDSLDELIATGIVPSEQRDALTQQIEASELPANCMGFARTLLSGGLPRRLMRSPDAFPLEDSVLGGLPSIGMEGFPPELLGLLGLAGRGNRSQPKVKAFVMCDCGEEPVHGYFRNENGRSLSGKKESKEEARGEVASNKARGVIDDIKYAELIDQINATHLPEKAAVPLISFVTCECNDPRPHGTFSSKGVQLGDAVRTKAEARQIVDRTFAGPELAGQYGDLQEQLNAQIAASGLPEE